MRFLSSVFLLASVAWAVKPVPLYIGKFESRALFYPAQASGKRPVVIMLPGSGNHGPEEMMPGSITEDGNETSIFQSLAEPFYKNGVHVLALGKPGIEFFSGWSLRTWYYNAILYQNLKWIDLLENTQAAVQVVREKANVDPDRVYLLGHSEGTQVAVDYAAQDPRIRGLILMGYLGSDLATILKWQFYDRVIENFVATDVDANHDGKVSVSEALAWPEFHWPWQPGQCEVSVSEVAAAMYGNPNIKAVFDRYARSPLYGEGVFTRGSISGKAANLPCDLHLFTGAIDMQTPLREAQSLLAVCQAKHKMNCTSAVFAGLGHGFSQPKSPRRHPLLDLTVGPVNPAVQEELGKLARSF